MNRPRRTIVAPQRLINEVSAQPRTTTRKTKSGTKTTLNLDLADVPPSDDRKFAKDFALNEFWFKNFYTPKDATTDLYIKAIEKFENNLPANFLLNPDYKEAYGIGNLELNQNLKKPIKKIPLFSKLDKGDYQTSGSKSDKNISASIKFFRNNLPSFQKYKNQDDISWVVNEHRRLTAEILDYYGDSLTKRVATLKGRFNAITRIFRIAFETKNYDLYEKYSAMVIFLGNFIDDDENENELSEIELKKFITFDIVLDKQKQLQDQFEAIDNKLTTRAYDLNQDLLLISLYSLIPPLRNEIKTLKFTKSSQKKEDWIYFRGDDVILDLNEEKKRHDSIYFNLTDDAPELAKIIKESYELYPRPFVFTHLKKYPDVSKQATQQSLDDRITKIFAFTGKMVSVNTFRSSYYSYVNREAIKNGKQLTMKQKEKIAYKMRTSVKYLESSYLKIFPLVQEDLQNYQDIPRQPTEQPAPIAEVIPAYKRQLERNKRYYDNNKAKVLQQQKQYKDAKPLIEKSRIRLLHFLNNDANYYNRMKKTTFEKYQFKKENGRWV